MNFAAQHYGADLSGLVCGYTFPAGGPGQPVDSRAAAHLLETAGQTSTFLWLHFSLSHAATQRWLHEHTNVPQAYYDLLLESPTTRLEVVGDALLGVVNDVQFFSADPSSV